MKLHLADIVVKIPPQQKILFKINRFELNSGEHLLIRGASGKGKTTLLHLIAGLLLPHQGTVRVGETTLTALNDEQRCHFRHEHVGMVFQRLNLLDHLTAHENVELGARHRSDEVIKESLRAVGLQGRDKDPVMVLSLGEQQRVAVARVVARGSSLILADEPTSSLDEKNAQQVMSHLQKAAAGKTLVVVSHDDRIAGQFRKSVRFEELIES